MLQSHVRVVSWKFWWECPVFVIPCILPMPQLISYWHYCRSLFCVSKVTTLLPSQGVECGPVRGGIDHNDYWFMITWLFKEMSVFKSWGHRLRGWMTLTKSCYNYGHSFVPQGFSPVSLLSIKHLYTCQQCEKEYYTTVVLSKVNLKCTVCKCSTHGCIHSSYAADYNDYQFSTNIFRISAAIVVNCGRHVLWEACVVNDSFENMEDHCCRSGRLGNWMQISNEKLIVDWVETNLGEYSPTVAAQGWATTSGLQVSYGFIRTVKTKRKHINGHMWENMERGNWEQQYAYIQAHGETWVGWETL